MFQREVTRRKILSFFIVQPLKYWDLEHILLMRAIRWVSRQKKMSIQLGMPEEIHLWIRKEWAIMRVMIYHSRWVHNLYPKKGIRLTTRSPNKNERMEKEVRCLKHIWSLNLRQSKFRFLKFEILGSHLNNKIHLYICLYRLFIISCGICTTHNILPWVFKVRYISAIWWSGSSYKLIGILWRLV